MTSKKYTPQEVARLILRNLKKQSTQEETKALEEWLQECHANRQFYESLQRHAYFEAQLQEYLNYDSRQDWKLVKQRIRRSKRHLLYHLLPYAAILVLFLAVAAIIRYKTMPTSSPVPKVAQTVLTPGSSKALLILENGESIDLTSLSDSTNQTLAAENVRNSGTTLTYDKSREQQTARLHTLRIPRGGEYELILSDGTKVWLNAETELTYPATFTGQQRQVLLKGEAYFEVAHDATRPFHVMANDMDIQVLGTSFNISAYPDSKRQTTLVEGQVSISLGGRHTILHPGEQATETPSGLEVRKVNVINYTSWRERRFIYEDKLLGEVMEDLGRWYNVNIFIANEEVYDYHLTANLPKYENMDKVLEIIKYAAGVQFEVNNRTVIVRADR